jgi:hypothetical protein
MLQVVTFSLVMLCGEQIGDLMVVALNDRLISSQNGYILEQWTRLRFFSSDS